MFKQHVNIIIITTLLLSCNAITFSQTTEKEYEIDLQKFNVYKIDDSTVLFSNDLFIQMCKDPRYLSFLRGFEKKSSQYLALPKTKFLTVHGNVSYDFYYRSKLDTPFVQEDFKQHTERVTLDLLVKEKYPFHFTINARQSNSPFFRNFFDFNLQLDRFAYNRNLKQELINKITKTLPTLPVYAIPKMVIANQLSQYFELKNWLNNPATLAKIVAEREKWHFLQLAKEHPDTLRVIQNNTLVQPENNTASNADAFDNITGASRYKFPGTIKEKFESRIGDLVDKKILSLDTANANGSFISFYNKKKEILEKLEQTLKLALFISDSTQLAMAKEIQNAKQKIYLAKDEKALLDIAKQYGLATDKKAKLEKTISSIKNIGIGRSLLNYTELTAQNITVTGVHIEYNPSYYVAFAAGKIDYRFRDFFNRDLIRNKNNPQYLVLGRVGLGEKDKRALIATLFQGRKSTDHFSSNDTVNNTVNVMGYSLEAIWKKNDNTFFSMEFAKSTKPATGNLIQTKQTNALFNFKDNSNVGINVKAQTRINKTNTNLNGFYRSTGEGFQSFSLFTYNTNQKAWLLKAEQSFYKKRIQVTGILRQNDFTNPFTDKTFNTNTTFKSLLLNIRIPKYPMLSLGYYPATQLFAINKETIRENAYYILNGSLVYSYFMKGTGMNTSIVYNKFINNATDSGFVYYRGVSYFIAQTIFFKKLQLQADYAFNKQPELTYYTLQSSADYNLNSLFKIGAGIKYNKLKTGAAYIGGRGLLYTDFKKFGILQLQFEKSYLPTLTNSLFPIETGRISWFKTF